MSVGNETLDLGCHLSPREAEIVDLLLAGNSRKQVASRLGISQHTVGTHIKRIYKRCGVQSLGELFALYFRRTGVEGGEATSRPRDPGRMAAMRSRRPHAVRQVTYADFQRADQARLLQRMIEHHELIRNADAFLATYGALPNDYVREELHRVMRASENAMEALRQRMAELVRPRGLLDLWKTSRLAIVLRPGFLRSATEPRNALTPPDT